MYLFINYALEGSRKQGMLLYRFFLVLHTTLPILRATGVQNRSVVCGQPRNRRVGFHFELLIWSLCYTSGNETLKIPADEKWAATASEGQTRPYTPLGARTPGHTLFPRRHTHTLSIFVWRGTWHRVAPRELTRSRWVYEWGHGAELNKEGACMDGERNGR